MWEASGNRGNFLFGTVLKKYRADASTKKAGRSVDHSSFFFFVRQGVQSYLHTMISHHNPYSPTMMDDTRVGITLLRCLLGHAKVQEI